MKNTIIEYKGKALRGNIELGSSRALIKALPGDFSSFWDLRHTNNKMCVLSESGLTGLINDKCDRYIYGGISIGKVPLSGDTLFISSNCLIPRTLLRSDYKITIKPENADYIVMPNQNFYETNDADYNIAAKCGDTLILLRVIECNSYKDRLDSREIGLVQTELDNFFGTSANLYYMPNMERQYAYFTKKSKEVKDIIYDTYPTRKYIYEKYVNYDTPSKINPDTLFIWSQMSNELKEKAIVSSDWKEYPFTVWNFIRKYSMTYGPKLQAFISVRNYLESSFSSHDLDKNLITAKDWNMFQKWIFKITGISEEGGTMPFSAYNKLTSYEKSVLFKRIAIKPYFLDESKTNQMRVGDILPEK